MLNEFTSYTSNLDATKNDSTHKVRDRGYCPNGTDIGRPVAGSLPMPPPSSSWNYPYLSNLYNYYNPNSYELGNVPQYDNQKCSSQYVRNYNEHSSRFHSASVLQCCDPRCQLIAKHAKYPYHPANTKINQHPNKRTKNYYGSIVDLPKPDPSVTSLAPSIEHTKYTPCVPYPTLRNDLNGKYSNQPTEYCSPFTNTLKRGAEPTSFNEYYTDIGNPSYWNKPNTSIWNRNSSSYYPSTFEDKNTQKIDQGNFNNGGSRGILFNRLLEHRDHHPYDTGYSPNYYYGSKNNLNPNINYNQPPLPCEPVINDNRLPLQTNSYQPPPAYNIHYPPSQTIPQYYKENTQKRVPEVANQESRILDKNPNLDVREFLSTWEDDVDDEKVVEPTTESPVIVLDCSNLEGDVLAKVKEKLNSNSISNEDTAILKIVDVSNSGAATVLSPHTSVIQENAVQSKETVDKSSLDSSHMNSDGYMTWYSNGKKKEDFSYDLVEMTERLVNTVGKLLTDPEKKGKSTALPVKEPAPAQFQDSHSRLLPRPLPALPILPNGWNPNLEMKKDVNIPPVASNSCMGNASTASSALYHNYATELDRNHQPLTEKNVSCTFNLQKTSNDLKFSVNYSTQQNDYNVNKIPDTPSKFKSTEFNQPYYEYNKISTANPIMNASNYKSYSTYSSYYENMGCTYDQTKVCNTSSYNAGLKDGTMNYVDHIEKNTVNDTDITLVKADLEKSLNEISHSFKSHRNDPERNFQYFDSSCSNTTQVAPKLNENLRCNERTKVIETQSYNGVIQKTGICNSPLQKIDITNCNDSLLSMPSLSPPPNSSSAITQPIISSSISKDKERPLCGMNLTLTDVYENEDTIFDTSQEAETNTFIPFCSGNQTPSDQAYQPLNLAVSRDSKPQESNFKDQQKIECDETYKVVEGKTNSKADDGYYSVENTEADEISGNDSRKSKSSFNPISVAYHPCIVSHEQQKLVEIHDINQPASETITHEISSYQKQQDPIIVSSQPSIGENNSIGINSDDMMKPAIVEPNKESTDNIVEGTELPEKSDKFNHTQAANSFKPVLQSEDTADQNDTQNQCNSNVTEKSNQESDTGSLNNSSNQDEITSMYSPHSEMKSSNHFGIITGSDDVESVEEIGNESIQIQAYEQEDTALNLKIQPDTITCPTSCGSVIKENEHFIHHPIKENDISPSCLKDDPCETTINSAKNGPELSYNSDTLINGKQSPKSVIVDYDVNRVKKDENLTLSNDNTTEQEVRKDQLKRKSIDTSINNINLPMKKRKGQDYLSEQVETLELTVTPTPSIASAEDPVVLTPPAEDLSVLTASADDLTKDSYHSSSVIMNHYEKNEPITDVPKKNKKKKKKDKSRNNLKHKTYSKFKQRSLSKEQIEYEEESQLFDQYESLNSMVSEIIRDNQEISSSSSSPIYNNNDDMFNIPSIAPTPQFDLIQDFEPQKEHFDEKSSGSFNLSNNASKPDFMDSAIDLHMMKAPSPNCVLQDDSFISEQPPNRVPSPFYDYNYEGRSPSSVAPSPNYDIIEGVLFDDTDSSRNNEDVDCKNKDNLILQNVNKYAESQGRLGDFKRSVKYSITENEYESDYEIDRYYFKRKRDNQVKRLLKKSKHFSQYNHHEKKSNNYNNSKFSMNIFRHFDYAVDDERCIRSEDDEYEPRPNHIRHAFKPKSRANYIKAKENGKHMKKYHLKYDQRDRKRIVDSECDHYFSEKKSTYISSPDFQLPASVSSQCDKIISKFQMIESTRSDLHTPDDIIENGETFKERESDCRSPQVISRDNNKDELFSDTEEDDPASSPAHTENIHSPLSIMESDAEMSDFQDTSKLSNHSQNGREMESPVDSIINNESDLTENQNSQTANMEIEKNDSPVNTMHTNHLDEHQPSGDKSHQLSLNSRNEKISPEENVDTIHDNSSAEKSLSNSDNQKSVDQLDYSFNEQDAHSLDTSPPNIEYTDQYSPSRLEENICQEVNNKVAASPKSQLIPNELENEPLNIQPTGKSTVDLNESNANLSNNESISDIPSENSSNTELNDGQPTTKVDKNLSQSNIINIAGTESTNSDEDSLAEETFHCILSQVSDQREHNEKTLEISPVFKQSLPGTDNSFQNSTCGIVHDDHNNSNLDIICENEINIPPTVEDELVGPKNISQIQESVHSPDYSSNSPKLAVSQDDEIEENVKEMDSPKSLSNSRVENEPFHSSEKGNEFDNLNNNHENDETSLENESICSLNRTESNNSLDTVPVVGHISQNIDSPNPVIQHNICSTPNEEVSTDSSKNHVIFQKDLCEDLSTSENLSADHEKLVEEEDDTTNESEVFKSAVHLSESSNEPEKLDTSMLIHGSQVSTDILQTDEHIDNCDSPEPVDYSEKIAPSLSKTDEPMICDSHSPVAYLDDSYEETPVMNDVCQRLLPLSVKDDDVNKNKLLDLESYSQESVFDDSLNISDCNDSNICKIVESYESSLDAVNTDLDSDHQTTEDPCTYSDDILFATNNSNSPCCIDQDESLPTSCNQITDIAMETGLCDTSNCLTYEVPTLRFLAIKALSRATINNNLLEVRETPERTEIIIHSEEPCDPADFEDGDTSNLIMTDTFDDDTHVSPNFEALKEMTFDYSTLPESTSSGYEEKNDEDLPCQCLIISSEESILCLRCSLNSSVDASQFHEMNENCDVSVSSLPDDTPSSFDCVEGDCIEQSFIDQEINFATTSPVVTLDSVDSSPCSPVVENIDESIAAEKTQIKVQLPWHRIFNLGDEPSDGDNVESSGVCRQRVLELGPAQIEIRMLSDDCSWWKNSSSIGNSSPVVKVKRLVLQRAAAEVEAEESNSTASNKEQELAVSEAKVEPRKGARRKSCKNVEDGERTLNEILGVPKMVIRKTSCRQYKSYLRTHRILQPVVCLKKNKRLDELALKYQQGSEPLIISVDDLEPKPVNIELSEEIVTGANEEAEVSQEICKEFDEEASTDVETKEEIGAGVSEEVSQEVSLEFDEEAKAEVETAESIVAEASEELEVNQPGCQEVSEAATVEVRIEDGIDEQATSGCEIELTHVDVPIHYLDPEIEVEVHNTQTAVDDGQDLSAQELTSGNDISADQENLAVQNTVEELGEHCSSTNHFLDVRTHFSLRSERHHCMLCHLSYNSVEAYKLHLRSPFHRHLELMQRETVHALYRRFTGHPCPSLRPLSARERKIMKWKPRNADVNHFYHYKAPLQIALQKSVFHGRNNRSG